MILQPVFYSEQYRLRPVKGTILLIGVSVVVWCNEKNLTPVYKKLDKPPDQNFK